MLVVFATLSLALLPAILDRAGFAVCRCWSCLALSIGLFLFEVYSPEYGFRMPWLQVCQSRAVRRLVRRGVMNSRRQIRRLPRRSTISFCLAMMLAIAAILTWRWSCQYCRGEFPCPLCRLSQRVAMPRCFGIILHFRHGYFAREHRFGMLFALFC